MLETENAVLYQRPPEGDDDDAERLAILVDEDELSALLDDTRDGPWRLTVHVTDDVEGRQIPTRFAVLETARRWFGPVEVEGRPAAQETMTVPADHMLILRVAATLHVPSRLRGGVEQQ